ncbi:MAG TPA: DUF433 domain-containing protein [Acetobacteraceae bacterium]|nr:DUF433 domain-containing protein [Acetobacteraceae bacterium]
MQQPVIARNPDVMGGTQCSAERGTRVPVQTLLGYLEAEEAIDDVLDGFPSVSRMRRPVCLSHSGSSY